MQSCHLYMSWIADQKPPEQKSEFIIEHHEERVEVRCLTHVPTISSLKPCENYF